MTFYLLFFKYFFLLESIAIDVSGVHSTKHTYISVKEGIKYKRTFILWHVSLHMTGAFCK